MPTLDFPSIEPDGEEWEEVHNAKSYRSELTGVEQSAELPGHRWRARFTFSNRQGIEARALKSFIRSLRGTTGRFKISPSDSDPYGTAQGIGKVNGASQTGNQIITDGWSPNQSELFRAGDYCEINGELKEISEDISSDVSGNATLVFTSNMRNSPPNDADVITASPKAIMKLTNNSTPVSIGASIIYSLVIECEEAIDV